MQYAKVNRYGQVNFTLTRSNPVEKFDPRKHFRQHELSARLEDLMVDDDYIVLTTEPDQVVYIERLLQAKEKFTMSDGSTWRPLIGFPRDKGFALLVREDSKLKDIHDLGYITNVGDNAVSVFKRLKREWLMAHKYFEVGTFLRAELADGRNIAVFQTGKGQETKVLYIEKSDVTPETWGATDGHILLSASYFKRLTGLPARPGDNGPGTLGSICGHGKGQAIVDARLKDVDIVIFGVKPELKSERFFFGLSYINGRDTSCRLDVQTMGNMGLWQPHLAVAQTRATALRLKAALYDWELAKQTFSSIPKDENRDWLLMEMFENNVPFARFPATLARWATYIQNDMFEVKKGRVPLNDIAARCYWVGEPLMWNGSGMPDVKRGKLKADEMCCFSIPNGVLVMIVRNPNQPQEKVLLKNRWLECYRKYKHSGLAILGIGAAQAMETLGNGDGDDSLVIFYDPKWVEAMVDQEVPDACTQMTMTHMASQVPDEEMEQLVDDIAGIDRPSLTRLSTKDMVMAIQANRKRRIGVGAITNAKAEDFEKSRNKPGITTAIQAALTGKPNDLKIVEGKPSAEHLAYMTQYECDQLGWISLVDFIDAEKKTGESYSEANAAYTEYHHGAGDEHFGECMVYTETALILGRIPKGRLDRGGFIVVETPMSKALKQMARYERAWLEAVKELQWTMERALPEELDAEYPSDPEVREVSMEYREMWTSFWADFRQEHGEDPTADAIREANHVINELLDEKFNTLSDTSQEWVAIQWLRDRLGNTTYKEAPKGEDGLRKPFTADRGPLSNATGHRIIAALNRVGIAGRNVRVEFYGHYGMKKGVHIVNVKDSLVYGVEDAAFIGRAKEPILDGGYTMTSGLLEVKGVHPSLVANPPAK